MCCLLTSEIENSDKNLKLNSYIKEARRMDIVTISPNINKSGLEFRIEKGVNTKGEDYEFLRTPLTVISGVGAKAVTNIVDNQPFKDIEEFVHKIEGRVVNKRVFESLLEKGCMQSEWKMSTERILELHPIIKDKVDKEKKKLKKQKEKMEEYNGSLFDEFNYDASDLQV